jgi:hypothetical protein
MRTELIADALRCGTLAGAALRSKNGSLDTSTNYASICPDLEVAQSAG